MGSKRSGPGALAGAAEAGIECSERRIDTVSHIPQQSLSPERLLTISRALRRRERWPDRDDVRRFIKAAGLQNVGRWIIRQVSSDTFVLMDSILFALRRAGPLQ
jgi:hypothetical protein